ncbi:MAG: hypothetical protein ABI432_08675 [Flavobacteriales bacterium]
MYTTAKNTTILRGDATLVARMSLARGYNGGKGYTREYVSEVLHGTRNNADILNLHTEVIAMRTPATPRRRK